MSLTLGLQTGHEASAVLFENGRILAAVSDERLSRIKNDGGKLQDAAIDEVLRIAGRSRAEVAHLALLYTFFPEEYFVRETWAKELERRVHRWRRGRHNGERPQMLLNNFIERLESRGKRFQDHFRRESFLRGERFADAALTFHDHHDSHALPAAWFSGFQQCAVMTLDGNGDRGVCHTSGVFQHGRYRRIHRTDQPGASAGLFYSHITRLLGFQALRHEGKVVGLAALGDPGRLYSKFEAALGVSEDGTRLDSTFMGAPEAEARRYAYLREAMAGASREDVSAAAQKRLEDVVLQLVRRFLAETGMRDIALNGGVFANVKLNQRIAELSEVDRVFVFPAMSDTGNAVGAALLELAARDPGAFARSAHPLDDVYWGPEYSQADIAMELKARGLNGKRMTEDELVATAADAIHAGRIVGWFQGRMEFGPRALGNRSMIARPTDASINDWLNQRLERSEFMPFAPSVLEEHADELFTGVSKARHTARFMTITFDVRPEWRGRIPAVVHVDGTARPQLVNTGSNPLYHKLISAYYLRSGIPLVLNTSFNVHEEPIVCAPPEALQAFVDRRVDCLAIGPFWLAN